MEPIIPSQPISITPLTDSLRIYMTRIQADPARRAAEYFGLCKKLELQLSKAMELHRMQLTAVTMACMHNTRDSAKAHRIDKSNPYFTPSLQDVYDAVDVQIILRESLAGGTKDGG